MFDPHRAAELLEEPFDGLSLAELKQRGALIRELLAWADEREALFRAAIDTDEAER